MGQPLRIQRMLAAILVIAILALPVAGCGGDDDDEAPAAVPVRAQPTAAPATPAPTPVATEASVATATPAPTAAPAATATAAATAAPSDATVRPAPTAEATAAPPVTQQPGPADTTFRNYGRTPWADTLTDAVSTFSLDTDRSSYFLALNWAQNGYMVEPDSVRAEEWVNAFAYGYDPPGGTRSFAITSDVLGHPLGGGMYLARVAFQAPRVAADRPLNVTLVLDASGSMEEGNRLAIAREAAQTIRRGLGDRDRIAVVHFTTDVLHDYTVEHTAPGDAAVARSIEQLAPHGSTNVQAGLDLAVQLADAARRARPDAFNYIILMSDGVANVDATNPFAILEASPDLDYRNPLRLITIGVGIANYNDELLEQLAQHGNGWYRYLDDPAQARETFRRDTWLALSTPFADQVRAQVTWDPGWVQAWRIVGYENRVAPDHTFEQNRRAFAELHSGAATTVFYELLLRDPRRSSAADLGDVEVRWVDPRTGDALAQQADVTGRTEAPFDAGDRFLRFGAIVALAADRYSALSPQPGDTEVDARGIYGDLVALLAELDLLEERLGAIQAYRDFRFLLDRLTVSAAELAPASGYSP